ncbi:hypothetical protein ANAEL_00316 [Anaerolineales bacterium]|nr:hypothetical protein ANAEL_00316 [Anaerolineales bacterium]
MLKFMKSLNLWKAFAIFAALCVPSTGFSDNNWSGKHVGQLQSTDVNADCFYFSLEGVSVADPVKPDSQWFAIPRTQYGAKEAYVMLLSVKLTGGVVNVATNGTLSCGYATVRAVWLD